MPRALNAHWRWCCVDMERTLQSEALGVVVKLFLRLQCHCFPPGCGCVSVPQQVPSAECKGGQCHTGPWPLESAIHPSQTCQSPPVLPKMPPKWHMDQLIAMCALQETLSDPQEMITICFFFLGTVLIKCPALPHRAAASLLLFAE